MSSLSFQSFLWKFYVNIKFFFSVGMLQLSQNEQFLTQSAIFSPSDMTTHPNLS